MNSVTGSNFNINSTLQSLGGAIKTAMNPQTSMGAQIITGSIQQGNEMESAVRSTTMQDMGKGLKVDTQA